MLTHLAMMFSAVSGWSLPPSDGSAHGSPLTSVNQSEITDGVVLAHDRRDLSAWRPPVVLTPIGAVGICNGWSVSPLQPNQRRN